MPLRFEEVPKCLSDFRTGHKTQDNLTANNRKHTNTCPGVTPSGAELEKKAHAVPNLIPQGRQKGRPLSSLRDLRRAPSQPSAKTLGYFQPAFPDEFVFTPCSGLKTLQYRKIGKGEQECEG